MCGTRLSILPYEGTINIRKMAILPYSYKSMLNGNNGGGPSTSSWKAGHPLHFGLTAVLFLITSYLYMYSRPVVSFTPTTEKDITLSQRLERSEAAYQRSIAGRDYLTKMYGSNPLSYPSEPPYPPYTVGFLPASPLARAMMIEKARKLIYGCFSLRQVWDYVGWCLAALCTA